MAKKCGLTILGAMKGFKQELHMAKLLAYFLSFFLYIYF